MAEGGNQLRERVILREGIEYKDRLLNLIKDVDRGICNVIPKPDFTEWKKQRKKTLSLLNELRGKLDNISVSMSYLETAGSGTGIMGSVTSIIGGLMTLGGLPAGSAVMNAGELINNSGNLTAGVSRATNAIFSTQYLQQVASVLETDKDLSKPFLDWLIFSRNLDSNIQEIFGCSLSSLKLQNVANVFNEFLKIYHQGNDFQSTLDMLMRGRYSPYIGTDVQISYLHRLSTELETNKSIALSQKLRLALTIFSNGLSIIQLYRDGSELFHRFNGNVTSSVAPTLRGGLNPDIPSLGAISTFCAFQTIDIAVNVVFLLSAVRVIQKGESKYSDTLKELEKLLHLELLSIENLR
ncbi:uncharacterized protein NPIL_451461 [Nephila pilipes]|uniref:Uncharacterized protein n=1 Tax=Nephila pilipes TaxID=299642 RepID=A0A8X6QN91_NEPPI|nr:uncharacterized protein NPIL_451461 [Nephila pilipes]